MSDHSTVSASEYVAWAEYGLKDFGDFAECVEYVNQSEYGDGQLEGEWWYADEDTKTVYWGSFGNYNSPGASHYTYAEIYDDKEGFDSRVAEWGSYDEYLATEEDMDYAKNGDTEWHEGDESSPMLADDEYDEDDEGDSEE